MELDASIEPTIGPYEVYEDEWLNQKAAFEAFIAIRDEAETAKLARFAGVLQELEDHLPDRSRGCATRSSARWRPSAWSTSSSPPATRTTPCRPPPTTSPTTSGW